MALKITCTLLAAVFMVGYATAASSGKAVRLVSNPDIDMPIAFLCRYALASLSYVVRVSGFCHPGACFQRFVLLSFGNMAPKIHVLQLTNV